MQKQPNKYPLLLVIYHPMQTWNSAMHFNMQVVVGSVRRTWMQKQKQLQWRRKKSLMEVKKQDNVSLLSIGEDTLKMWSCTVCVTIFVFRFYNIKKCKYTPKVKCICDTYILIILFLQQKLTGLRAECRRCAWGTCSFAPWTSCGAQSSEASAEELWNHANGRRQRLDCHGKKPNQYSDACMIEWQDCILWLSKELAYLHMLPLNFSWAEVVLWSGIKKGPPRKLKFPDPTEVVSALKEALKS